MREELGVESYPCFFLHQPLCCSILDNIMEGVFAVDGEKRILFFNKAAERITGFSKDEALGKYCYDIFRSDSCETHCFLDRSLREGTGITGQKATILNKDGIIVPVMISTSALRGRDGTLTGGIEIFHDLSEIETLRKEVSRRYSFRDIVTEDARMKAILDILPEIAISDSTVLIQGESGTGKELIARAIHDLSHRRDAPLVPVNCGALPDSLLESELFGYKKGAFTGAVKDKPGRIALAEGGTLFLDEVGEMSPALQVKLLRFLEQRRYMPLGGVEDITADVRIIAATQKDLSEMAKKGRFRDDLYYRLNIIRIELPPLRERIEDVPLLIDNFIKRMNACLNKSISGVSEDALNILMNYRFPGNVRELENIIERAAVLCKGRIIDVENLPSDILNASTVMGGRTGVSTSVAEAEADAIRFALRKNRGIRTKAARDLGISRTTLWRKMRRHGIV